MKIKLLLLGLIGGLTVTAQTGLNKRPISAPERAATYTEGNGTYSMWEGATPTSQIFAEDSGTVFYYEDFANGFAGGWDNASLSGGNELWEFRGPNTSPNNDTGSIGAFAAGTGTIASTSEDNGFMIFDSDWWDNGGDQNGAGTGLQPTPHRAALTSPAINCAGQSEVFLSFESYLRQFNSFMWVIVTNDNFSTADTFLQAGEDIPVNESSADDVYHRLNITSTAGGQGNVRIRFVFESDPVPAATGYYFWQIDDIVLRGSPTNDLALEETFFKGASSATSSFQFTRFYDRIPVRQISGDPLTFGGALRSLSTTTQTNSRLEVSVTGPEPFTSSSTSVNYSTFAEADTVDVTTTYNPSTPGTYNVTFAAVQDAADDFIFDNEREASFRVTEHTYAWDNSSFDDAVSWGGGTHSIYTKFDIYAADTIEAVEIGLWSSDGFETAVGSVVQVGVWPVTGGAIAGDGEIDFTNPIVSDFYTVEASDLNNSNLIRVDYDPTPIPAGITEVVAGYKWLSGTIRTANSQNGTAVVTSFVDVGSDDNIDGWVDFVPIVHMITYESPDCSLSTLDVTGSVSCDFANNAADIDVTITGGVEPTAYEWSNGDDSLDITVTEEGMYTITVTDDQNCVETAEFNVTNSEIICNLSVGDVQGTAFNMTLMPNPNNGVFNVQLSSESTEDVKIIVQSMKGEVVYEEGMSIGKDTRKMIDLEGAATGVYLLKVIGQDHSETERLIIR